MEFNRVRKMKKALLMTVLTVMLFSLSASLYAIDILSEEGVKCTYTHHDMWKGKMSGEGMLFVGIYGVENEKIYMAWGKNRNELLQREGFSLKDIEKEKEKADGVSAPPYYQKLTEMLKKALEWDAAADENGLDDVRKPIALGWAYHKLKKGTPGWVSKTWGGAGKYEIIEIRISEIPKLLILLEKVPELEKRFQDDTKRLKDEADRKKADEKAKKDKVDSILK